MKINKISREQFLRSIYNNPEKFCEKVNIPEVFIIQRMFNPDLVLKYRNEAFENGLRTEPSWHPLKNDCPDYHRLHDNYPQAYVKQKMHAFYYHGWKKENKELFNFFSEIFHLKNFLAGYNKNSFLSNIPADGIIARINIHHYPIGGGYQAEHIDPVGKHALIQTLIVASAFGKDYKKGGVYGRPDIGQEAFYFDSETEIGDMIVMSPGIPHGVAPVDEDEKYSWTTNDGRWIILPIFVKSDYEQPDNRKPQQIG